MSVADTHRLLDDLTDIASKAGEAIRTVRQRPFDTRQKADRSLVTAADEAAEALILDSLARLLPGMPVVSEEAASRGARPKLADDFILVDPLDGTRDFIDGLDDFTVNIAIISKRAPVLGVVAAPALETIWRGIVGRVAERLTLSLGAGVTAARDRIAISTRPAPATGLIATHSRSHLDPATTAFIERLPNAERVMCGSALKFCRVAEGAADVYPRLAPTSEWDVAAGHAVVAAAGGIVTTAQGEPIIYGGRENDFRIPAFLVWGDPAAASRFKIQPGSS